MRAGRAARGHSGGAVVMHEKELVALFVNRLGFAPCRGAPGCRSAIPRLPAFVKVRFCSEFVSSRSGSSAG